MLLKSPPKRAFLFYLHRMKRVTIIVAGGSGTRMQSDLPKQFLELSGMPVLAHTLHQFHRFDRQMQLIVVLPAAWVAYWENQQALLPLPPHEVVEGGSERFFSVQNGLRHVDGDAVVAVHDAVRPFVSLATLSRCFDAATLAGSAVPVLPLTESLREVIAPGRSKAVERARFRAVQTPQCFHADQLKKAYEQPFSSAFTDDASVMEAAGFVINTVEGNPENIKLTSPSDLLFAEALLQSKVSFE
jgi:2-C-methyl-D-erythritol 4-phosphate cytidylyltransferase